MASDLTASFATDQAGRLGAWPWLSGRLRLSRWFWWPRR